MMDRLFGRPKKGARRFCSMDTPFPCTQKHMRMDLPLVFKQKIDAGRMAIFKYGKFQTGHVINKNNLRAVHLAAIKCQREPRISSSQKFPSTTGGAPEEGSEASSP